MPNTFHWVIAEDQADSLIIMLSEILEGYNYIRDNYDSIKLPKPDKDELDYLINQATLSLLQLSQLVAIPDEKITKPKWNTSIDEEI